MGQESPCFIKAKQEALENYTIKSFITYTLRYKIVV